MASQRLSTDERTFFRLVADAALANPFGPERLELDGAIGNAAPGTPREETVRRITHEISSRIHALDRSGHADPARYGKEDGDLLRASFLFHTYHQFLEDFNRLIQRKTEAGKNSEPARFAVRIIESLEQRGFTHEESVHYLCLFYQLRRAHFLIYQSLIGRSPSISRLRRQLWENVFPHNVRWFDQHLGNRMEEFSTLLLGETGTGKGASAAAIGRSSYIPFDESKQRFEPGFHATFIRVNLSRFSENLLESELFGHRKGAFTGAADDYEGHLARCMRHGAIFLDELGDISPTVQTKLLKVLEDRTFTPAGSHDSCRFEGQIIAATNRDLNKLREQGVFRDDLYYHLCSDVIRIPPLRTRIQEDPREFDDMVTHLVGRMVGEGATDVTAMVKESLQTSPGKDYTWPGNVRELEQAIRRVILNRVCEGDERLLATDTRDALVAERESGSMSATEVLQGYCRILYDRHRNYVEVARIVGLDRHTAKKYIEQTV